MRDGSHDVENDGHLDPCAANAHCAAAGRGVRPRAALDAAEYRSGGARWTREELRER